MLANVSRSEAPKRTLAAAGSDSHFFTGECTERGSRVKGLRFAPMNAPKTRAVAPPPSPLLFASSHRKNVRKKWERGAQRERQDELRHHSLRLRRYQKRRAETSVASGGLDLISEYVTPWRNMRYTIPSGPAKPSRWQRCRRRNVVQGNYEKIFLDGGPGFRRLCTRVAVSGRPLGTSARPPRHS